MDWATPSANHYVVGALLLSNHVVNSVFACYLFWKADRMVKMSKAAVRNASGSVFGSYQQQPVVRFFVLILCVSSSNRAVNLVGV